MPRLVRSGPALSAVAVVACGIAYGAVQTWPGVDGLSVATITAAEAAPIVATHRRALPGALAGLSDADLVRRWPIWTAARDREIRARLLEGDEDSVVHLWLFGTSFTSAPRATTRRLLDLAPEDRALLLERRLEDLLAGTRRPADNERLLFARRVIEHAGIDVMTPAGAGEAAKYLRTKFDRMTSQLERFRLDTTAARQAGNDAAALHAYTNYYRSRGLSSDTSVPAAYAVERALRALVATGRVPPASLRRVAIIGPGLDFVDKAEGHDLYPVQTLQPFALADSLRRNGLAHPDGVEMTALDINPYVVEHLEHARARAARGDDYVVHLPLESDGATHSWDRGVVSYWQRFGNFIGGEVAVGPLPPDMESFRLRAVRVRPEFVASLRSVPANIVFERLPPETLRKPFDLIVSTNVLVYYEPFEQALALANVAAMLAPGGVFLTNTPALPLPASGLSAPMPVDVVFDRQGGGDTLYWITRVGP